MFIKLTNGQPENYSIGQLRRDNPQVSFPSTIPTSTLEEYGVYPVTQTDLPAYDGQLYACNSNIELVEGVWTQIWMVKPLPQDQAESNIRTQRDQLLAETDWIVSRSYEQGISVPTEWQTYRQALRDIPSQAGFPFDVVWPNQP